METLGRARTTKDTKVHKGKPGSKSEEKLLIAGFAEKGRSARKYGDVGKSDNHKGHKGTQRKTGQEVRGKAFTSQSSRKKAAKNAGEG
jgi:hypothetical protein